MDHKKHKLVLAVTGASGAIYARLMLEKLLTISDQLENVAIVFSETGKEVWTLETGLSVEKQAFKLYDHHDFNAPFASGSSGFDIMLICPCTMGTMGKIAAGIADDLISRSADVILKERRKLILLIREMPFNLIHIENMKTITLAGGIICPASPSFYSNPGNIDELATTVTDRVLSLAGFEISSFRWGQS